MGMRHKLLAKVGCAAALAALIAYVFSFPGCGGRKQSQSRPTKVIIMGVDGADMLILDKLRRRGELPNFDRLISEGSSGLLRSIEPILSPLIWTSIATGKTPDKHGIFDFVVMDPAGGNPVPVTSQMRQVKALWNIAGESNARVAFIGWLATWPAEDINGVIASDRLSYHSEALSEKSRRSLCSPAPYLETVEAIAAEVPEPNARALSDFIEVTDEELDAAKQTSYDAANPINNLRLIYKTSETYLELALDVLARERPDLMGIYFEETDSIGHLFMQYAPPRMPNVTDDDVRKYGGAVDGAYRHMDRILGKLMAAAGDEYTFIVLSDHGFKTGESRPRSAPPPREPGAARWHRLHGIVILSGPHVRRGFMIEGASVLDIAPTVLALMGLPVAEDMDGRPLTRALDKGFIRRHPIQTIATYETGEDLAARAQARADRPEAGSEMDEQMLEKLKSLGYLGSNPAGGGDKAGGGSKTSEPTGSSEPSGPGKLSSWHSNRGVSLLRAGKYAEAEEAFRQAIALNPSSPINRNNIGLAQMSLGEWREAEASLKKAVSLDPGYVKAHLNLGLLYDRTGADSLALKEYRRALEIEPSKAGVLDALGNFYAKRGRYNLAFPYLRKANEVEPQSGKLRRDYGAVCWSLGNLQEAERQFQEAVSLEPDSAQSQLLLAKALLALGRRAEAEKHLKRCLDIDPRNSEARKLLGR